MATFEQLMEAISAVKAAEKVTKESLSSLSRDLLSYMLESNDVRPVNRLLGKDGEQWILTPINWRIAVQYFHHFLPWTSNYADEVKDYAVKGKGSRVALRFKSKTKNQKSFDKKMGEIHAWLEIEANDIWVWSNNATIEAKPVDYAKNITNAVHKALDKGGMSTLEVMKAVLAAEEISPDALMKAIEIALAEQPAVEEEQAEAA